MINPKILEVLTSFGVPEKDGLTYLLSLHYECFPSYVPSNIIQKINVSQILTIGARGEITWLIPLFIKEEDLSNKWHWVSEEYNLLFGNVNAKRKGPKTSTITRMKAFFAENPDVRKEEVIGAVKLYLQSVTNPEYMISSHYFISKGVGKDRCSNLELWVDKYKQLVKEIPALQNGAEDFPMNKMQ